MLSASPRYPLHGIPRIRRGVVSRCERRLAATGFPIYAITWRRASYRLSGLAIRKRWGAASRSPEPHGLVTPILTPRCEERDGLPTPAVRRHRRRAPVRGRGIYIRRPSLLPRAVSRGSSTRGSERDLAPSPGRAHSGGSGPVSPTLTSVTSSFPGRLSGVTTVCGLHAITTRRVSFRLVSARHRGKRFSPPTSASIEK